MSQRSSVPLTNPDGVWQLRLEKLRTELRKTAYDETLSCIVAQ